MKAKIIRDPIHGYINIDAEFVSLVDHYLFQRLRRIEQTSMRVLFPSARHDRFAHSLGVYHLGKKAFTYFISNVKHDLKDELENNEYFSETEKLRTSFMIACLLHDVGHSPFSHTFEKNFERQIVLKEKPFHNQKIEYTSLRKMLLERLKKTLIHDDFQRFEKDFGEDMDGTNEQFQGNPHEQMSGLVILEKFLPILEENFEDIDLDLIIRAIIGCTYYHFDKTSSDDCLKYGLRNCLIRLLNSNIIDVDKLDYLNRDMVFAGYDNVLIDVERLLSSITAIKTEENNSMKIKLVYRKSALSVVENAIIAKKSFNRWIYNHHAIECEQGLISDAFIECIDRLAKCPKEHCPKMEECKENKNSCIEYNVNYKVYTNNNIVAISTLFSLTALTDRISCNDFSVSYLGDDDLWYLFKRYSDVPEVMEIYHRSERRRPVCKSDEEMKSIICMNFKTINVNSLNDQVKREIKASSKEFPIRKFFDVTHIFPELKEKLSVIWALKYTKSNNPIEYSDIIIFFGKDDNLKPIYSSYSDLFRLSKNKNGIDTDCLERSRDANFNIKPVDQPSCEYYFFSPKKDIGSLRNGSFFKCLSSDLNYIIQPSRD
jgi:HD superfamily phosphohydrolase